MKTCAWSLGCLMAALTGGCVGGARNNPSVDFSAPAAERSEPASMTSSSSVSTQVNGVPDDSGVLALTLPGIHIALSAPACQPFSSAILACEGVEFVIASTDVARQSIDLDALYINPESTLFRGDLSARDATRSQSVVMADINADGRDDLMLWTGQLGAYGGASYSAYVFEPDKRRYAYSAAFSELTVGRAGLFEIENGRLLTGSKSGCCLHTQETFALENGNPVLVERVEEDATGPSRVPKVTVFRRVDGQMVEVKN